MDGYGNLRVSDPYPPSSPTPAGIFFPLGIRSFKPMSSGIVFKPVNGAHAVVETVFFFEFAERAISDKAIEEQLAGAYAESLPQMEEDPSVELSFDAASQTTSQRVSKSFTFSTQTENEAPEWAVRILDGTQVSIHCTAYTRWDAVSKQAFQYFALLEKYSDRKLELNSFGFKVVDRFQHEEREGAYDLNKLLKQTCHYLPSKVFESGDRWHNNSGWFWPHPSGRKILNHLNVNSSAVSIEHLAPKTYVTIDHVQALRREDASDSLFPDNGTSQRLATLVEQFFQPLHHQNKIVVNELLTEETCRRLSLVVGERI